MRVVGAKQDWAELATLTGFPKKVCELAGAGWERGWERCFLSGQNAMQVVDPFHAPTPNPTLPSPAVVRLNHCTFPLNLRRACPHCDSEQTPSVCWWAPQTTTCVCLMSDGEAYTQCLGHHGVTRPTLKTTTCEE